MWTQLFAKAFAKHSNDDKYSPGLESSFFSVNKEKIHCLITKILDFHE